MGISTSRLCDRRAYRGRIDGEYRTRAPSVASRARTRGWRTAAGPTPVMISLFRMWAWRATRDRADAGHDLAFRKMAVADDPLPARLGLEIAMPCEKLSNLRFDGL